MLWHLDMITMNHNLPPLYVTITFTSCHTGIIMSCDSLFLSVFSSVFPSQLEGVVCWSGRTVLLCLASCHDLAHCLQLGDHHFEVQTWNMMSINRVAEHIACNHLAFVEMFLLGRASLQLPWVTCLCGSRWTICLTSCIFLTWSSPFTRVNISFYTLWFSLWNKN